MQLRGHAARPAREPSETMVVKSQSTSALICEIPDVIWSLVLNHYGGNHILNHDKPIGGLFWSNHFACHVYFGGDSYRFIHIYIYLYSTAEFSMLTGSGGGLAPDVVSPSLEGCLHVFEPIVLFKFLYIPHPATTRMSIPLRSGYA